MFIRLICFMLLTPLAHAGLQDAQRAWEKSAGSRKLVIELVDAGHPFAAIPFMKDFLVRNQSALDESLDRAFEKLISYSGVRPFEVLPDDVLARSRSSIVRYILAKKYFRKNKTTAALEELTRVNANHPVYPFALNLRAAIHGVLGKNKEASTDYRDCVAFSNERINAESNPVKLRQLYINRDSCIAGMARIAYNQGDWSKAESLYLDVSKSSYVWPEILFEEAWTSYYLKNYNRTLGKLVSYKAPVLDFMFNPEIDVLRALAFLRLCLYNDTTATVEDFYNTWLEPSKSMRGFLVQHGRDYDYFFRLATAFEKDRSSSDFLMQAVLLSVVKDPAWQEMKQALIDAVGEHHKLKGTGGRFGNMLVHNIKAVVGDYQNLLGAYARSQFHSKYNQLVKSFQGMSFIKLEVLSRRKQAIYDEKKLGGKRGDVRYIERNDKQYFWDFNGEFWADELGDYVFALRSEC